jgi:hypothetical protein
MEVYQNGIEEERSILSGPKTPEIRIPRIGSLFFRDPHGDRSQDECDQGQEKAKACLLVPYPIMQ